MQLHHTVTRALTVAGLILATATPTLAQEVPLPTDTGPTSSAEAPPSTEAPPPPTEAQAEAPPPTEAAPATTTPPETPPPTAPAPTDPPTETTGATAQAGTTVPETTEPAPDGAASVDAALVDPNTIPGNPTCADVEPPGADWTELKIDPPTAGVHTDGTLTVTITIVDTPQGPTITWSSNIGVDAVLVKGGDDASLYVYDPESTGDSGLHAPANPNGKWAGLSHFTFCYDASGTTSTTTTSTTSTTSTTQPTTTTTSTTSTTQPTTTSTSTTSTTQPTTTSSTTSTTAPPTTTPPSTQPPTTPPPPPTTPSPFGSAIGPVVLTEDLPRTGSNTGSYVIGGLALLALGAGLTVAAKKATSS